MAGNTVSSSTYSPSYIKAKTPEDLQLKMLMRNVKDAKVYDYFSIQFANGFWYAWYNRDNSNQIKMIRKEKRTE